MNSEPPTPISRYIIIAATLAAVVIAAFFIIRGLNDSTADSAASTLVSSAVAVAPTNTEQATETSITKTLEPSPVDPTSTKEPESASEENTAEPSSTPEPKNTPTSSPSPTPFLSPTPSPTSKPQIRHSISVTNSGHVSIAGSLVAIPTAVPQFNIPGGTTNVLLLGSDTGLDEGVGRTDTMIIVAINRDGPTASMVSLPRDLYVYIPGWTMNRLNTALARGSSVGYPGGAVAQLRDTILYNFGVPIHYYAQIDFDGFEQAVDIMDGVEVAVSCELTDWRLKSPELDIDVVENWEKFTLEPGIHEMDGDTALWYARSRLSTSDFDRGRRQQQLLRSILNQGVDLNLLPQVPEVWATYQDTIKTDIDIGRLLQFASLAPAIRENNIQHLYIVGDQLEPWVQPDTGAAVQLPVWENMQGTFRRLFLPPALNQATRPPITVEIINGTANPELALLAADNFAWYGFEPIISDKTIEDVETTLIKYYAQNLKGSFDWLSSWVVDKRTSEVELVTDTPFEYDYQVVLGSDYDPCRPYLFAPQIFLSQ